MENQNRMKNMLISDKHFDTKDLIRVLKSDTYGVFVNYFDIIPQDISIKLEVDENGIYKLSVNLSAERLKIFGSQIK